MENTEDRREMKCEWQKFPEEAEREGTLHNNDGWQINLEYEQPFERERLLSRNLYKMRMGAAAHRFVKCV